MASKGIGCLSEAMGALRLSKTATVAGRQFNRSMATAASTTITKSADTNSLIRDWNPVSTVPLTIHGFPSLEPTSLEQWSVEHLYLPLRRDLLHLAVVYEGDNTRQGTASTKNRWEVHGSHRKMHPQKGTGRARRGTKQSPLLRGGGKSFGPKPRDFGTHLTKKVYDKAWRTALSYRYRKGELIVTEDGMDLPVPWQFNMVGKKYLPDGLGEQYMAKYLREVLKSLELGKGFGKTLFVTGDRREQLWSAMEANEHEGEAIDIEDVDIKDILSLGKVVMERSVLKELIERHQSDLVANVLINGLKPTGPEIGQKVLG